MSKHASIQRIAGALLRGTLAAFETVGPEDRLIIRLASDNEDALRLCEALVGGDTSLLEPTFTLIPQFRETSIQVFFCCSYYS